MGYLEAIAADRGIPDLWVEDCAQECRIALWRAGLDFEHPDDRTSGMSRTIARRRTIDFYRWLFGRTKDGSHPHPTVFYFSIVNDAALDGARPVW